MRRIAGLLIALIALLLVVAPVAAADGQLPHTGRILIATEGDITVPAGERADLVFVTNGTATIAGEATALSRWAGLGKEAPMVAGVFAFFLLAMAGIPLTSGFIGKWAVFAVALSAGAWPVVLAAILASIISVYFYVRVILLMFFAEPEEGTEVASITTPSLLTSGTIAACVVLVALLGIVPGPILDLAGNAGQFIR